MDTPLLFNAVHQDTFFVLIFVLLFRYFIVICTVISGGIFRLHYNWWDSLKWQSNEWEKACTHIRIHIHIINTKTEAEIETNKQTKTKRAYGVVVIILPLQIFSDTWSLLDTSVCVCWHSVCIEPHEKFLLECKKLDRISPHTTANAKRIERIDKPIKGMKKERTRFGKTVWYAIANNI